MRILTITPPAIEPVSVADAKQHARVDIADDDNLIAYYITQAREYCEKYCNIGLITQTKAVYFDGRDVGAFNAWDYLAPVPYNNYVRLPLSPIQSIVSINSYDTSNVATLVDPSYYYLSGSNLVYNDSFIMPNQLRPYDAWEYRAVVGFGDNATDVPMQIRMAILRLVAHAYQNREAQYDSVNGGLSSQNVRNSVTADLSAYREFYL